MAKHFVDTGLLFVNPLRALLFFSPLPRVGGLGDLKPNILFLLKKNNEGAGLPDVACSHHALLWGGSRAVGDEFTEAAVQSGPMRGSELVFCFAIA